MNKGFHKEKILTYNSPNKRSIFFIREWRKW